MDNAMPQEVQQAFRKAGLSRRGFLQVGGGGVAGAALLTAAGCGGGSGGGSGEGKASNVLNRNIAAEVDDLDSATATDEISFEILTNVKEGLYRIDADEKPQLAMAKSVETSDDELTHTFTLRDDIKWSNGDPVTSADFRFAWLKALDPDTASQYAYIVANFIKGAKEFNTGDGSRDDVAIEAPDDKTLKVTLTAPVPFFFSMTAFPTYFPQHEKFVKQQGKKYANDAKKMLYNGPYTLQDDYNPASGGTMKKNPKYWDASNVGIEEVNMVVQKDRDASLQLYQSGKLDMTGLGGEQVARFKDSPEFWRFIGFTNFFAVMNQKDSTIANKNIRKAIMLGFDREKLAKQVLQDGSEPAYAFVPPGMAGPKGQSFREANGKRITEGPGEARGYWKKGVEELGKTPDIKMIFGDSTTSRELATFLKAQFREHLGIKVSTHTMPFEAALDRVDNFDYQVSWASGWGADYNDPLTFLSYFLSDSGNNRTGFSNKEYDGLVNGAREEKDDLKRMQMMGKAEKILFDEAVLAPEYFEAVVGLVKPYVKHFLDGEHPFGAEPDWKLVGLKTKEG